MRALLDTNIIIHRESMQATNYSIGQLFYWLDKLHYEKLIHPYSVAELRKADNAAQQDIYNARLAAYTQMKTVAMQTDEFKAILANAQKTENDIVDNQLLYEIYCGRADILITEDRKMRSKAEKLGITDRVFSINAFILYFACSSMPGCDPVNSIKIVRRYMLPVEFLFDFGSAVKAHFNTFIM